MRNQYSRKAGQTPVSNLCEVWNDRLQLQHCSDRMRCDSPSLLCIGLMLRFLTFLAIVVRPRCLG